MRNIQKILKDKRITYIWRNSQKDKVVQLKVNVQAKYNNKTALVKFTRVLDWEHLSVSFKDEIPSWDFMQEMKELFWEDEEVAFQLHPAKSNYINNDNFCLHIWRPLKERIPLPPTVTVGLIKGKDIDKQLEQLKKLQEEVGSPLTEGQLTLIKASLEGPEAIKKAIENVSITDIVNMLF